jgi:hypothetical protein
VAACVGNRRSRDALGTFECQRGLIDDVACHCESRRRERERQGAKRYRSGKKSHDVGSSSRRTRGAHVARPG